MHPQILFISILSVIASSAVIDPDVCMTHYRYTYSKCLQICSNNLDPTCLDDQLCFCNSRNVTSNLKYIPRPKDFRPLEIAEMGRATIFGVPDLSNCKDSKFCSKACQDIRLIQHPTFTQGILCSSIQDTSITSCVCGL